LRKKNEKKRKKREKTSSKKNGDFDEKQNRDLRKKREIPTLSYTHICQPFVVSEVTAGSFIIFSGKKCALKARLTRK
jgi:hypothetical protein